MKIYKRIYQVFLLFMILWGAHAWFTWPLDYLSEVPTLFVYSVFALFSLMYMKQAKLKFTNKKLMVISLIIISIANSFPIFGLTTVPNMFCRFFPLFVLIADKDNIQEHINFILKSLAIILIPGILLYVLLIAGRIPFIGLPSFYGEQLSDARYIFTNYVFLLDDITGNSTTLRFRSIFLEPGYLGTMLSFLIYANKFSFSKWYEKVIFGSLILSFSLAGYMLTFVGYIICQISEKKRVYKLIVAGFVLLCAYWVAISYNNGDNFVNEYIVERLVVDDDKGISGNNRFSDNTVALYEFHVSNGDILFGVPRTYTAEEFHGSAGYMVYFIFRGVVSALLCLLFYIIIAFRAHNRIYSLGFVLLLALAFLQASYPMSPSWYIPFFLGFVKDININNGYENFI